MAKKNYEDEELEELEENNEEEEDNESEDEELDTPINEGEYEVEEQYGIVETLTAKQFLEFFNENNEIRYKSLGIGLNVNEDGSIDVLKHTPETEEGYVKLNKQVFLDNSSAIAFAVDYLVKYDDNGKRQANGTIGKAKTKSKSKSKTSSTKTKVEPKPVEKFKGPRVIRVFGRDIYVELDEDASDEDIRIKLVNEHGFPNFSKDKVMYMFDESVGILEVALKFQMKG